MPASATLLRWYDRHGRNLPWRCTRNAYYILVSEIMLQQTQVSRVLVYYERWLNAFPNWARLARATNAEVIALWSGLGYNRRALILRDIARVIIKQGEPKDEEGWRALKGIGSYTAAALTAFSLHERVLPIDTNIRRVGARLWLGVPFPSLKVDERIRRAADKFLPKRGRFYDVPQALFDLANLVCTKTPHCPVCPMRFTCLSAPKFIDKRVRIPRQSIKKAVETKHRDKPHPDRIYRGRILKVVQKKISVNVNALGRLIDSSFDATHDQAWLLRILDRMQKDQMIDVRGRMVRVHRG